MTGPEHYREAERLLRTRTGVYNGGQTVREEPPSALDVARAQAHATLAQTAALTNLDMPGTEFTNRLAPEPDGWAKDPKLTWSEVVR